MSCFSELTYAMYADQELLPDEARQVDAHVATCARCRSLLTVLREENQALAAALAEAESEAPTPVATAAWARPAAWTGLAAVTGAALWYAIRGDPGSAPGGIDWWTVLLEVGFFVASNAGSLGSVITALAVGTMAALTIGGGLFLLRRPARATVALGALGVALGVTPPALALETRAAPTVSVPAGETVDGTLVASGDTVRVDGTIAGDLIAAARSVEVRGTVKGDLIVAGRDAHITGTVDGNVYALAGALHLGGHVTRSLYGVNRATTFAPGSRVDADVNVVGQSLRAGGTVGRSMWLFVGTSRIEGLVGRDLTVTADRLEVRAPARIEGNVKARTRAQSDVEIDPGVPIGGTREVRLAPRGAGVYAEPRVYFWIGTNLFGALLLGFGALVLAPGFFHGSAQAVGSWWQSLGLGAAVLVVAPIAIVLVALTVVGLPVALVALSVYLLGLYAAKIVVGAFLGRALLRSASGSRRDSFLALLVGLLVLTIAFQLPFVGTMIRLVVLCLGLGALSAQLYRAARPRTA